MATKKKKYSSKAGPTTGCDVEYSPSMYIDLDSVKELKGLEIEQEIRVVIRGKVKGMEQRQTEKGASACITLTDFEAEIVPVSSQLDSLFDDESDD